MSTHNIPVKQLTSRMRSVERNLTLQHVGIILHMRRLPLFAYIIYESSTKQCQWLTVRVLKGSTDTTRKGRIESAGCGKPTGLVLPKAIRTDPND